MRILLIEDSENDAFLEQDEFDKAGINAQFTVVSKWEQVESAMEGDIPDLIVSDYDLRTFTAFDVLASLARRHLDIPVLVVSGVLAEDLAKSLFDSGAHDFFVKQNLTRLVPAALRELEESEERQRCRKTEAALRLAEVMQREVVGKLAGGIGHDFNNLLTAIIGYGQLVRDKVGRDHPTHPWLQELIQAGEKAAQLTHLIMAFGQKQILRLRPMDLNGEISRLRPSLSRLAGTGDEFSMDLDPGLPEVYFDPQLLGEVLATLVTNAVEATSGSGHIQVRTGKLVLNVDHMPTLPMGPWEEYALISVADDGIGMVPEVLDRVFQPYFTTKPAATRTGLGLSLAAVQGVITQCGGFVTAESAKGKGSRFTIHLPLVGKVRRIESMLSSVGSRTLRGLNVLVLGNDAGKRKILRDHLEALACQVLESTFQQVPAGAANRPSHADLVLLDSDSLEVNRQGFNLTCATHCRWRHTLFVSARTPDSITQPVPIGCPAPVIRFPSSADELMTATLEALRPRLSADARCKGACLASGSECCGIRSIQRKGHPA